MKQLMSRVTVSIGIILWLPFDVVSAQNTPGADRARDFVDTLNDVILFPLIGLLAAVAFLLFLWGCVQYIMGANNEQARTQGVRHITFGIIGLVIMMSAWSILTIAAGTFGLSIPQ